MYKFFMSTSGFRLAPYSLKYNFNLKCNFNNKTFANRVKYFALPYRFMVALIPNKL